MLLSFLFYIYFLNIQDISCMSSDLFTTKKIFFPFSVTQMKTNNMLGVTDEIVKVLRLYYSC